jgi:mono/diheme cytochrome c family protein
VLLTPEVLKEARAHFADHCATCHANDGSGETKIGKNFYPKTPDLRLADTQDMSDGEMFFIIQNGIRFTGMPAWGTGDPSEDTDSWKLVHFIRHLPRISKEELVEMKALNPKTAHELEDEAAAERFLRGEDDASPASSGHRH